MAHAASGRVAADKGSGRITSAAFVLGVALSGFFDGILLHQVLQWHHLLSLVPGERFRDLRVQVFADGLFHVAMYLVAAAGLWLVWRTRASLNADDAGRRVIGGLLIGFGVWNIVDVGFFHWILGIHSIRVNVPDPLLYDLAWFLGLGVVVAIAGYLLLRRQDRGGGRGVAAAAGALALLAIAIPIANRPMPGSQTVVLFRPGMGVGGAVDAIAAAQGRIVMIDPAGSFAIISLDQPGAAGSLYRSGALLVSRSPAVAGCLAAGRRTS
jgi:uncharacterized membrane protein